MILSQRSCVLSTATAVCVQRGGRGPAGTPEVRVIWRRLRRVLPGPRPLLLMGWPDLLPLLLQQQEVDT